MSNEQRDMKSIKAFSDSEILKEVRSGNRWIFAELIRRYQRQVSSVVHNMLGRCVEAEDIGQEVFIRFYKAIHTFREESGVGTYLTRIAINLSLNEIKRRKKWRNVFFNSLTADEIDTIENLPNEVNDSENNELKEQVDFALSRLNINFRSVVILRLIEGYSVEETAEILNLSLIHI